MSRQFRTILYRDVHELGTGIELMELVSESAKLIQAINEFIKGEKTIVDLIAEMVDLDIMIERITTHYQKEALFESMKHQQLLILQNRVRNKKRARLNLISELEETEPEILKED